MVSLILNGKRQLSLEHIRKLAARFNISPALFVWLVQTARTTCC
ncbi:hypothetical protein IV713_004423 [Salmonella enterica]|uniref:HTH cro/C1-type domain-containing protein n=1 Tax=Salmonella enterica TaxID=28901 RepID=A0A5Z3B6W9_SALER|nr:MULTISPECIES: hypothetical protein [Enterobacteriaceae]ELK6408885.1 hypothetical protein [Citrobacter freundii]ELS7269272.1 hypothetical protein [Escherichia coli]EAR4894914.1 hypothetical protein [Salmonella enterica]EAR9246525.1 hypothetical protein [Salmonella enterica]EAT8277954.1 hypothetical protein [Salmonella enterica]